jgi:phosphatidylinositol alpha-mannosyltransferase
VTQHITHLAEEFIRGGHEVHIMAPCSSDDDAICPVPLHRLGRAISIPANGSIARIGIAPRPSRDIRQILASTPFDIVHLHEPLLPALPLAVLRSSRATNIGTFHAYRRSAIGYFYAKPFLQYFFAKLDGRIAVSACARDFVAAHFPGQYRVVPNGIDYQRFSAPRPRLERFADGALNVLFVGRLEKRKGLSYLLRAWGRVHAEFPSARLIVVGGGSGLKHYSKFVGSASPLNIFFTGQVSDDELTAYYHTADLFCAPSTGQESFGIILLEAMAAGRAIVTTSISGYTEVITHDKEGLLVAPKDSEALAAAIIHVLADGALRARLGSRGQQTAQRYAWARVADEVLDYYTETVHRRKLFAALRRPRFRRMRRVASGVAHLLKVRRR